jgi:spore coat polysaccharide biosynthesis predicted glycosyltransferase SpsG
MNSRILIRVDCDGSVGFGHFSRCLSLARVLRARSRSVQIAFWGRYDAFAESTLKRYRIPRLKPPARGFAARDAAAAIAASREFDLLLVDSYHPEQAYLEALQGRSCKLAVIEDRHVLDLTGADLVICFRAGAELMPHGARKEALGLRYLIVKPELRAIRRRNLAGKPRALGKALVFFTGRDVDPVLLRKAVTATLSALPQAEVSYITRDGRPLKGVDRARPRRSRPDIEKLYAEADLIVTGGGLVKYESAYCAIPNVALSQTALQDQDTKILAARHLTHDLGMANGFDVARVAAQLAKFAGNSRALAAQRRAFRNAMDADGTQRLAARLLSL